MVTDAANHFQHPFDRPHMIQQQPPNGPKLSTP